jgi:hypothetical protein
MEKAPGLGPTGPGPRILNILGLGPGPGPKFSFFSGPGSKKRVPAGP